MLIESVHAETMQTALHVIMTAGYGYEGDYTKVAAGHAMSFVGALRTTVDHLFTLIVCPSLLLNLPFKTLRRSQRAYREFGQYLHGLIDVGKHQHIVGNNILQTLVQQARPDPKERVLSEGEILGNAFVFLIAGQDTMYSPFQHMLIQCQCSPL